MDVVFRKQIHSSHSALSSNDIWLERKIALPFTPFVGLEVTLGEWSAIAQSVCWDVDEETFAGALQVFTEDDKQIYDAQLHGTEHPPLLEIVDDYLEEGWTVEDRSQDKYNKLKFG